MAKITAGLAQKFCELPEEETLDVVLELGGGATQALDGAGTAQQMKKVFADYSGPVKEKIRSLGGDVTGEGWLNGTLQARLTRRAAESLNDEPSIASLDVPRRIVRE